MIRPPSARAGRLALAGAVALAAAAPGDLTIVSLSSGGQQGATPAEAAAVSADGRFVAFTSASDLTGAGNGKVQLYVRDRASSTTALASADVNGTAADQDVDQQDVDDVRFAISGDGRYVVFASTAGNLTPADADATRDVFRKDMTTGAVTLVSVNSAGAKANAAVGGDPDVSGDGNRVAFTSGAATNLFGADGNATQSDVVVRDIAAGTTVLAAQSTGGAQASATTERPAISADGRVVSFDAPTGTANLVPDEGTTNDVIVRNLATGTTSAATDPTAVGGGNFSDISGDGRYVVFETGDEYDAANDNGGNDVYRRDMGTGAIVLVSAKDGSDAGGGTDGARPQISADGGRVAFTSASTNLTLPTIDGNAAVKDVFVRDIAARGTSLASVNGSTQASTESLRSAIAADGGLVAFAFDDNGAAPELITADANLTPDILAKELAPSDAAGPALTLTGPADGASTTADRIAVGGTATDPSGIVSVTAGGAALPVTASGGFSTTVALALGADAVTVRALDGAGNATTLTRTVTRRPSAGAGPGTRARITRLSAALTKKGAVRVTLKLSAAARVRVSLLRSVKRLRPPRRTVLRTVGSPLTRRLGRGTRTVVLTPRRPLAAGRYVVRVRILSAAAGPRTRSVALRVRAR